MSAGMTKQLTPAARDFLRTLYVERGIYLCQEGHTLADAKAQAAKDVTEWKLAMLPEDPDEPPFFALLEGQACVMEVRPVEPQYEQVAML